MSVIISVYSKVAFKEFLLPATDNADFTMTLEKELFELHENVDIDLEIIDGNWRIRKSPVFKIVRKNAGNEGEYVLHDGDVFSLQFSDARDVSIVINFFNNAFCPFQKYDIEENCTLTIGNDKSNTFCYQNMNLVSRKHAIIRKKQNELIVEDCSSNGCFINGKRIHNQGYLSYGDTLEIFGLKIMYFKEFLGVRSLNDSLIILKGSLREYKERKTTGETINANFHGSEKVFRRAPRNIIQLLNNRIELEAPPTRRELRTRPALLTIGPSITMALPMLLGCILAIYGSQMNDGSAGVFMYTGIVTAVTSALIGTFWTILNMRYEKKRARKEEELRRKSYTEYLEEKEREIKEIYEQNSNALRERYPDTLKCCGYDVDSCELWNRNHSHEDFLSERLGIGELPFPVEVEIPKNRFSMIDDELKSKPKHIFERYKYMKEVPICVDLMAHRIIGIIGSRKENACYNVLNTLVAQIAANNCYVDVKLAFVFKQEENEGRKTLEYARWLPHVWSGDKKWRYVASEKQERSEILYELVKILRSRVGEGSPSRNKQVKKPHYVLIVDGPELLEGELISKYVFDTTVDYGLTTIFLTESYEELPNSCEYIVENTEYFQGAYTVNSDVEAKRYIDFDSVEPQVLENFSRRLSSIVVNEVERGDEIPSRLDFLEMYGVKSVEEFRIADRWRKNRTYENIKALIGEKTGETPCFLDIHEKYHGPHGLVAGTTGSGKSELLQTFILSLALNYSPDDIAFCIIDYKGGGMANLFKNLPHLAGSISNLSGNQVQRAMISIKSENLRRERIFNEYGVNNINQYTRLYKSNETPIAIPHLIIIIDEFAELKREEPDFMREIISVAQVGRSLGVHLILATQKPSGTVDENIWSNSKFKLCLRVQDRHDSNDMLHKPDAAYLTQAGRCYLQVGNDEVYELFQSGYSGVVYDEDNREISDSIAEMLLMNGRAAVIGSHVKLNRKEMVKERWISRMIAILEQVLEESPYSIEDCLNDVEVQQYIRKQVYQIIKQEKIEFEETKSNSRKLQDLIITYGEVRAMEQDDAESRNQPIAKRVIQYANDNRRTLPNEKERTQLEAIVEEIQKNARNQAIESKFTLWLPVLPERIYLSDLQGFMEHSFNGKNWDVQRHPGSLDALVGLYDDPENQNQQAFSINLAKKGNCAVLGGSVSGKSTFLLTFVYSLINQYSPDVVNIYCIDYSSGLLGCLNNAPHVGGVVTDAEPEQVERLFTMLKKLMSERKIMMQEKNSHSLQNEEHPAIVLVIDNMEALRKSTNNKFDDSILSILKEGQKYGMYVMASAMNYSMKEIPSSMRDCFGTTVCLEMPDKYAYSDSFRTMHMDVIPEEDIKGRGVAKIGDSYLEFQTALPIKPKQDEKITDCINQCCAEMDCAWSGETAKIVPFIPDKPIASEFFELEDCKKSLMAKQELPIGYGRRDAAVCSIDLKRTYCYMISGKNGTGKSNCMRIAMKSASEVGEELVIIDFSGEFEYFSGVINARYIRTIEAVRDYFLVLKDEFKTRNNKKKECVAKGMSDAEIYDAMQIFPKIFIFVSDLVEFMLRVDNPGDGESMEPFLNNILDKGKNHNVYWIAEFDQTNYYSISGIRAYTAFAKDGNGIHFGGKFNDQHALSFENLSYKESNMSMKPGIGMISKPDDNENCEIVVPLNDIR